MTRRRAGRQIAVGVALFAVACGGPVQTSTDGGNVGGEDAGLTVDAGSPVDAGQPIDAGAPDSGVSADAGQVDGGHAVDAGLEDAGWPMDGGLQAVPLTGCPALGYTLDVTLGGSQTFQMLLDTGSTTLAVASSACHDCTGVMPEYTPGPDAIDEGGMPTASFGDMSGWDGVTYQDSVQVDGVSPTVSFDFVAIDKQDGGFFPLYACDLEPSTTSPFQGIIGFGPVDLERVGTGSYMAQLSMTGQVPDVFAVQLCASTGRLWVGGYNTEFMTAPPQFTPLLTMSQSDQYYSVELETLAIGGSPLKSSSMTDFGAADFGFAVVDTGTSILILPLAIFDALSAAAGGSSNFGTVFPGQDASFFTGNTCLGSTYTRAQIDAMLPTLTMTFPGVGGAASFSVQLPPTESYLYPATTPQGVVYCPGVEAISSAPMTVLGDTVLASQVTIFDVVNGEIGFAPQAGCQ